MSSNLKIMSYNVASICNKTKRLKIFNYIKSIGYPDILSLIDTRTNSAEKEWFVPKMFVKLSTLKEKVQNEWPSRGISCYFNSSLNPKLAHKDKDGNLIMTILEFERKKIIHVALYRPNTDETDFLKSVSKNLKEHAPYYDSIIINGDFNLVQEKNRDSDGYQNHNCPKARKELNCLIKDNLLVDIASELSKTPDHTFFTNNTEKLTTKGLSSRKSARLDFFLVSSHHTKREVQIENYPTGPSDHSPIVLKLGKSSKTEKSKIWKLNNSLLENKETIEEIKRSINISKELAEYNSTSASNLLIKIPKDCKIILKDKGKKAAEERNKTKKKLVDLKLNDKLNIQYEIELEEIIEHENVGSRIRSRQQAIANSKSGKNVYKFLEKDSQAKRNISKISINRGNEVTDPSKIRDLIGGYFTKLFKCNDCNITKCQKCSSNSLNFIQEMLETTSRNQNRSLNRAEMIACDLQFTPMEVKTTSNNIAKRTKHLD